MKTNHYSPECLDWQYSQFINIVGKDYISGNFLYNRGGGCVIYCFRFRFSRLMPPPCQSFPQQSPVNFTMFNTVLHIEKMRRAPHRGVVKVHSKCARNTSLFSALIFVFFVLTICACSVKIYWMCARNWVCWVGSTQICRQRWSAKQQKFSAGKNFQECYLLIHNTLSSL